MINLMAMDFYVGPAVLLLDDLTLGVTAFIDSSTSRGLYIWGGFLDTHREELRFAAVEDLTAQACRDQHVHGDAEWLANPTMWK